MEYSLLQLALREWRRHMSAPPRAAALAGAALVLTLVGPFGTLESLRSLPRLVYWLALVVLCYSAGFASDKLAAALRPQPTQGLKRAVGRSLIAAPVTALLVFFIVWLLNGFALGYWPHGRALAALAANVMLIAAVIAVVFQIATLPQEDTDDSSEPPALLKRLPFDKRGALVSISVEDHYVHIRTTQGEEMVLMRLADAIGETGETQGLQVHRSHWVALDQISAVRRKGDGAMLTLTHGPEIPVSRANIAKIKEAGLVPQ